MIYKRGKNGIYSYRFRFAGRIIHESARTQSKTIAREAERNRRRELEERINGIRKRELPPTLQRAADDWQASRTHSTSAHTQSATRVALKQVLPVFGAKLLCDITPQQIAEYQQARLKSGAQGRTINIEVGVLRQVLKARDLWPPFMGRVKMLSERTDIGRALTPDEEKGLMDAALGIDSACHTAVVLALNTALRHSELLNLRWSQIDLSDRTLTVGRSKTTAGTGRLIPLNSRAFEALVAWLGRFPQAEPSHYVFPWCENRQIDPTRPAKGFRTAWRHARKLAGVRCRFHDLRVTAITKMAESQTPDFVIMSLAGHVSKRMTEHYSRIRLDAKRAALNAIAGPAFQGVVNQNGNQIQNDPNSGVANLLN